MSRIYSALVVKDLNKAKKAWGADAQAFLWGAFLTSGQYFEYGVDTLDLKSACGRAL